MACWLRGGRVLGSGSSSTSGTSAVVQGKFWAAQRGAVGCGSRWVGHEARALTPSRGGEGELSDLHQALHGDMKGVSATRASTRLEKAQSKERNRKILLEHLAEFVHEHQQWLGGKFPSRGYLSSVGRIDLAEAIRKLGGPAKVAHMFGLKWGVDEGGGGALGKVERDAGSNGVVDSINTLDKANLKLSIAENVEKGHSFMVEHTNSKTPMKESEWTLWKPPISDSSTTETVKRILEEAEMCAKHHPICYVRITAFDKGNFSRKITFLLHVPSAGS